MNNKTRLAVLNSRITLLAERMVPLIIARHRREQLAKELGVKSG